MSQAPQPPTLSDLLALLRAVPAPATALPWLVTRGPGFLHVTTEDGSAFITDESGMRVADAQYAVVVANLHPALAAAVERFALAVSGDRDALAAEVRAVRDHWIMGIEPGEDEEEENRRIGARLHALGAASRDEEVRALQAELATAESELDTALRNLDGALTRAGQYMREREEALGDLASEREEIAARIEAARAEGYAAGLAAAAPPVLAAVGALHGGRVSAATLSPPAMGGEESGR